MAKTFKKLKVGDSTSYVSEVSIDGVDISKKGEGKVWKTLELSGNDILRLVGGGQLIHKLDSEYDPTDYKNDYFMVKIDQTADLEGQLVYGRDSFSKVFVNIKGAADILPFLYKSLTEMVVNGGFDYNYYKTAVLYAGCTEPVGGAGYIASSVSGNDVIYIADVSQQPWEGNNTLVVSDKDIKVDEFKRERLEGTTFGAAFVISIKGKDATNTKAFMIVLNKSQASYVDSTLPTEDKIAWAYTDTFSIDKLTGAVHGVYPVTFDTNALRWVVQTEQRTIEGETYTYAKEMTAAEIASLLSTGIEFTANKFTAEALEDNSLKLFSKCFGLGNKYLSKVFSFNGAFESPETSHIEYIGRPVGYMLDTYTWYSEEWDEEAEEWVRIKHIEKSGEHVWQSDVQGVPIMLIIPDNIDEEGKAHRNTFILQVDSDDITTTETIFRHSFRIEPATGATFTTGDYKVICAFQAINTQMGDNTIDYILFSDESKQYPTPDWILPCAGKIGACNADGTVTTWYDIIRIKATYTADPTATENPGVRCLRFEYINESTMQIEQVNAITTNNYYKFKGYDFRSEIGTFKAISTADSVSVAEIKD